MKSVAVNLTVSQCKKLAEFIEFNFIPSLREDEGIDNINYIKDIVNAHTILCDAALVEEDKDDSL